MLAVQAMLPRLPVMLMRLASDLSLLLILLLGLRRLMTLVSRPVGKMPSGTGNTGCWNRELNEAAMSRASSKC